jgi:hypothetical protein
VGAASLTFGESAIAVGASTTLNFAFTGLAFEAGALMGSVLAAVPVPGPSDSVRDWLADSLTESFGPELAASEFACGW